MRSASNEAGTSLEQKSYYFKKQINVFFENVVPAAVRSASRDAPLEQEQEQEQEPPPPSSSSFIPRPSSLLLPPPLPRPPLHLSCKVLVSSAGFLLGS